MWVYTFHTVCLYHHFKFALSLQPCKESNLVSPLTASLQVLDKQEEYIWLLQTLSMQQPALCWPPNLTTILCRLNLCWQTTCTVYLILITQCNWLNLFLPLLSTFLINPMHHSQQINPRVYIYIYIILWYPRKVLFSPLPIAFYKILSKSYCCTLGYISLQSPLSTVLVYHICKPL